jgi:hypothetical protein
MKIFIVTCGISIETVICESVSIRFANIAGMGKGDNISIKKYTV